MAGLFYGARIGQNRNSSKIAVMRDQGSAKRLSRDPATLVRILILGGWLTSRLRRVGEVKDCAPTKHLRVALTFADESQDEIRDALALATSRLLSPMLKSSHAPSKAMPKAIASIGSRGKLNIDMGTYAKPMSS